MQAKLRPNTIPLNLRQIEVFHAIMLTGSLSEAARRLCVSQPALSRVLATAEQRLSFQLFDRIKGRLLPTPEARRLFSEAESIIEGVHRFNTLATGLTEGDNSTISIVSSPSYGEWLIPAAIRRYRKRFPSVRVKYQPMPFEALLLNLVLGHADLAVTSMLPPESNNVVAKAIGNTEICCAIPADHPLAQTDVITPDDLQGQTFIGFGQTPFGHITEQFLLKSSIPITPSIEIRSTPEALALVRQGVGIALVESFGAMAMRPNEVALRPLSPRLSHRIYQVQPSDRPLSSLAKSFLSAVVTELKQIDRS